MRDYLGLRLGKRNPGRLHLTALDKPEPNIPGSATGVWVETVLEGGEWFVRGRVAVQDERIVVEELHVVPADGNVPKGGITQESVLRRIPIGAFGPFALSRAGFAERLTPLGGAFRSVAASVPGMAELLPRPRPRRAAGRDDRFYALLARDYVTAIKRGSRSPIKDLASARGEKPSRIRDQVHEARERGLLSKSASGRYGGQLSRRGSELVRAGSTRKRDRKK